MSSRQFGPFSPEIWNRLVPWERRLDDFVGRMESELISIRRHLHAHPEPSGEEKETSDFVFRRLRQAEYTPSLFRNGVGVVSDVTVGQPKIDAPLVAVRAELDALCVPDAKTVDYASRIPGVSHACGHDAHTTIVLGAALAAAAAKSELPNDGDSPGVRLRFLFQPAEETSMGARWMVEQGALEDVDVILGCHVDPERTVGQAGIRYGALTANCDEVEICVEGSGGHAARPHHSIDPVAAAAHLISTLYQFLPRAVDSRIPAVFTVGKISGGYAPNVIPERVVLLGSLRTTETGARETLKKRLEEICRGVAENSGARITLRFVTALNSVRNHPQVTTAVEEACRRVLGTENITRIDQPSMGGEDFSVYLDHVPGSLLRLGSAPPRGGAQFLHSPRFDIDERVLALGTRILLRAAMLLGVSGSAADSGK